MLTSHLSAGNDRTGQRCSKEVSLLVDSIALNGAEAELIHELLAQVLDDPVLVVSKSGMAGSALEGSSTYIFVAPIFRAFARTSSQGSSWPTLARKQTTSYPCSRSHPRTLDKLSV